MSMTKEERAAYTKRKRDLQKEPRPRISVGDRVRALRKNDDGTVRSDEGVVVAEGYAFDIPVCEVKLDTGELVGGYPKLLRKIDCRLL